MSFQIPCFFSKLLEYSLPLETLLLDPMTVHMPEQRSMLLSIHIFLLISVPMQDHFVQDIESWSEPTLHFSPGSMLWKYWFLMYVIFSQSLVAIIHHGNKVLLLLLKNDHFSSGFLRREYATFHMWLSIFILSGFLFIFNAHFYIFLICFIGYFDCTKTKIMILSFYQILRFLNVLFTKFYNFCI